MEQQYILTDADAWQNDEILASSTPKLTKMYYEPNGIQNEPHNSAEKTDSSHPLDASSVMIEQLSYLFERTRIELLEAKKELHRSHEKNKLIQEQTNQLREHFYSESESSETTIRNLQLQLKKLEGKQQNLITEQEYKNVREEMEHLAQSQIQLQDIIAEQKQQIAYLTQQNQILQNQTHREQQTSHKRVIDLESMLNRFEGEKESLRSECKELSKLNEELQIAVEEREQELLERTEQVNELKTRLKRVKELYKQEIAEMKMQQQQELYISKKVLSEAKKTASRKRSSYGIS